MNSLGFYFLCIGVPLLFGLFAQWQVNSKIKKWSRVRASGNLTGAEAARRILAAAGIRDVEVAQTNGFMGDHYDPAHKRLCLSPEVYQQPSVTAVGVAAHEAGHAVQHARSYAPLHMRMQLVGVTQIASQLLPFVIIGGFIFQQMGLIKIGAFIYGVLMIFQLITLPVEFGASKRAKVFVNEMGLVSGPQENGGVGQVLNAAALTYVAAFVAALGNLIYLLLISRDR